LFRTSNRDEEGIVPGTDLSVVCDGLLSKIFQCSLEENPRGIVVALTSAHPHAGVSHITNALAASIDQGGGRFTMLLNGRYMDTDESVSDCTEIETEGRANLWQQRRRDGSTNNWHAMHTRLSLYLEELRRQYRYILIDCPSLREGQQAVILAPLVDGIVLVVEANRTQKSQFLYAERTIENAGGRILGHVLNKRTYAIPGWLHRKMESIGV
jgi:hypothetical protein